jgi:hypothetical protein
MALYNREPCGTAIVHRAMGFLRSALAGIVTFSALTTPSGAAVGCSGSAYHQLDFFVGTWAVTDKNGKQFATDRVSKEYGGCVVWEQWFGGHGSRGAGYSGYLPARRLWVQTFMDNHGTVLVFEGGRTGTSFTIGGPSYPKPGHVEQNHVIFRVLPRGAVEEYWTISDDRGKTSKVIFDGFFHPIAAASPPGRETQ